MVGRYAATIAGLALCAVAWAQPDAAERVVIERLPQGGIQPQAVTDAAGVVHVVYFVGDPAGGDLRYVRRTPDGRYSAPVAVNSKAGSAVAIASVRGAQIALGRDQRVHVVWNGSDRVRVPGLQGLPFWYTRRSPDGTFEPQRNVVTGSMGLDGGGTLAADGRGRLVVAWHAGPVESDARRMVYLSRSADDGATFDAARRIAPADAGACACCSMRALFDRRGSLFLMYRTARKNVGRDATVISSRDSGETFSPVMSDPWNVEACELTSGFLTEGPRGVIAAWETKAQVRFAQIGDAMGPLQTPPGNGRRKHPVMAYNAAGDFILAWVEGTAWARGGSVAWQVYDGQGRAAAASGTAPGVPVWGVAAAAPLADGRFLVIY